MLELTGTVVDPQGDPVPGAVVAPYWEWKDGRMQGYWGGETDAQGAFQFSLEWGEQPIPLYAMDPNQQSGAIVILDGEQRSEPARIRLSPLATVRAQFSCQELDRTPEWVMTYANLLPQKIRVAGCSSQNAELRLKLPAGNYQLNYYGEDYADHWEEISIPGNGRTVDLGVIDLEATVLARLYGKEAPEWHVTAARGIDPSVTVADFRGRWLILEFWAQWCGPCTYRGLPALMEFADRNGHLSDRFAVITFHRSCVSSVEELEGHLDRLSREVWNGKQLPFPVLLDDTGTTMKTLGIRWFPTEIFIDPEGRIVRGMDLEKLEQTLQPNHPTT